MDMRRFALCGFLILTLLSTFAGAQATASSTFSGSGFCGFLYGASSAGSAGNTYLNGINPSNYNWSSYTSMLALSLVIVIAVLAVMGLVYATGRAFGINSLIEFAKTEYFESFANVVIIVVVAAGATAIFSVMIFVSNIVASGISNLPNTQQVTTTGITTPVQMYSALCSNYAGSLIGVGTNLIGIYTIELFANFASSINVNLAPNNQGIVPWVPGFSFSPLAGLTVIPQALGIVVSVVVFVALVNIGLTLLLFVIYYLFPIFLYLGIVLRSFPWTRAAGGAFLALFIAFYIVFPALLYPFSFITGGSLNTYSFSTGVGSISSINTAITFISGVVSGNYLNTLPYTLISTAIGFSLGTIVQMVGFIIAIMISYDLMEALSDVLGAPSMTGGNLFKRFV